MHKEDGMGLPKDWQPQVKVAENEVCGVKARGECTRRRHGASEGLATPGSGSQGNAGSR